MYPSPIPSSPPVANPVGQAASVVSNAPPIAAGAALSVVDVQRTAIEEETKNKLNTLGLVTPAELGGARRQLRTSQSVQNIPGDGNTQPWQVLLFDDGSDPTAAPHLLPAIRDVDVLNGLGGAQLSAYLIGYGTAPVNVPNALVQRRRMLAMLAQLVQHANLGNGV